MKLSKHFDSREFDCRGNGDDCNCGGRGDLMNSVLIYLLEELRKNVGGYPLIITSGYRCMTHNLNVGGAQNSQHTLWNAADVACPMELSFDEFVDAVYNTSWFDGAGYLHFDGVGIYRYQNFIHVDVRYGGKGPRVEW